MARRSVLLMTHSKTPFSFEKIVPRMHYEFGKWNECESYSFDVSAKNLGGEANMNILIVIVLCNTFAQRIKLWHDPVDWESIARSHFVFTSTFITPLFALNQQSAFILYMCAAIFAITPFVWHDQNNTESCAYALVTVIVDLDTKPKSSSNLPLRIAYICLLLLRQQWQSRDRWN